MIAFGLCGLPSNVASTWLSDGAFPMPIASRCSCWVRQCARSSAITCAGSEIVRRPLRVFGPLIRTP